ncbi:MAG: helix-turn-helix transcriptional regulator [Clostridia bacterium]|nr:helix-turn-helix transcriptional regulator [Clostridia bacterium]
MVDFGVKLKQLRLQEGMTQQQLANRLGVTKSVVSYYELQERYPSPEVLIKLAGIFRTSSDYLLGLDKKECLDISDLEEEDIEMLKSLVASLRARKCKKTK